MSISKSFITEYILLAAAGSTVLVHVPPTDFETLGSETLFLIP